ncbi:MAG: O-antigen ligase family protein [Clostridia bacterium]|nr:O-antigen ligase family protein [Clostridia bacterium]
MENKYKRFLSFCKRLLENSFIGEIIIKIYSFFSILASGSFIFNMFNKGTVDNILEKESIFKRTLSFFNGIMEKFYNVVKKSYIANTLAGKINVFLGAPLYCITFILSSFFILSAVSSFVSKNLYQGIFSFILFLLSFLFFKNITIKKALISSSLFKMVAKLICLDISESEEKIPSPKKAILISLIAGLVCGIISCFSFVYGILALLAFALYFIVFSINPLVFGCIFMFSVPLLPTLFNVTIIILFLINFIIARAFGKIQGKKLNMVEIFTLFFMLFIIISSILSVSPQMSLKVCVVWIVMISGFFAVRRCIRNKEDFKRILVAFSFAALITGIYGIFQYLYGQIDTSWIDVSLFGNIQFRVYSTFENPNVYGEYLLLAIPVVAGLILLVDKKISKISCFGIFGILVVDLFLTYSRGCYLGLGLCLFMLIWLFDTKLIGVAIFAAIPALFILPQGITNRLLSILNLADSSTSYRIKIWHGTFKMFDDFLLTGIGPGAKAYEMVNPAYAFEAISAQHSHSLFLQIITEMGIFAFIIFCGMLFCFIRNGISSIRRTDNLQNKFFMSVFISALFGFLIQSIFDYTWYNYRVFMIFWIFIAMGNVAFELFKNGGNQNETI